MPTRAELLLEPVSRGSRILEIGASFSPIAPKCEGWDTRTLDHLDRAGLVAKYTGHPGVDVSRVEDVDYVWTSGPLADAVPAEMHGGFDAFIASHVIEHTTDFVGFLEFAAILLKQDGVVVLAVPDKRYCFDYFQPLTTTGHVMQAHAEQRSRHVGPQLFDHMAYAVANGGSGAWSQHPTSDFRLMHTLDEAKAAFAAASANSDYVDAHAWRFSPSSFQLLLLELARLGETDWRVDRITEATGCEFYAWLRRGGRAAAAAQGDAVFAERRLTLMKRTLVEARAQIDWLLAGEPELITGPLGLLPVQPAAAAPVPQPVTAPDTPRYVDWFPDKDNAARAFEGEWSSAVPGLPSSGTVPLFDDPRIVAFGERLGGFAGKRVLELGPLEGGHSYMMTRAGAQVTAIEANMKAWIRCLAVKNALDISSANFLLGDFVRYLEEPKSKVDFVLASGVLYHMTDPATVLEKLVKITDAIGLWTHYFDAAVVEANNLGHKFDFKPRGVVTSRGRLVEYYSQEYRASREWKGFCGGSAPGSNWLRRQDIIGILEDEGFVCETFQDHPDHQNGPAFCVFAQRKVTAQPYRLPILT